MADKSAFVALPSAPPEGFTPPADDFFTPRAPAPPPTVAVTPPTPDAKPTPAAKPTPVAAATTPTPPPNQMQSSYATMPAYQTPMTPVAKKDDKKMDKKTEGKAPLPPAAPANMGSSYGNIPGAGTGPKETSMVTKGGQPKRRWSFFGYRRH